MRKKSAEGGDLIRSILRMSQKALACTLAMIGVGYIGGLIAICVNPVLAEPLTTYAEIFTPVWQVEIAAYGVGSTLEKLQKPKSQLTTINQSTEENG